MSSEKPRAGIFVATMTGLAEMCGEEIEDTLSARGIDCERLLMDGLEAADLAPYDPIVIVSSTYGHGEIPDNGQALFASVEAGADLGGKRFAVFALGDRTYFDTFCAAGDRWEAVMTKSGAKPFVGIERHDAASGTLAEDVAGEWAAGWADTIG